MKQKKKTFKNKNLSTEDWMPFNEIVKSFLTGTENDDIIRISTPYLKKCKFQIEHGDTIYISSPDKKDYDYLYVMGKELKADECWVIDKPEAPFHKKALRIWWD